jgi:hypothetical protein
VIFGDCGDLAGLHHGVVDFGWNVELRTESMSGSLNNEVNALWGPPGRQAPPLAIYQRIDTAEEVLFSYAFFWDGFTGLAITIGAICTLFFVMQVTGRTNWRAANRQLPPPSRQHFGAPA